MIPLWFYQVFSQELKKQFSYRADFWVQFFSTTLLTSAIAYFLWKAIYFSSGSSALGGFSFYKMVLYYVMVPQIEKMVRSNDDFLFADEIYSGGLNRFIVYPLDIFSYKYALRLAQVWVYSIQFVLAVLVFYFVFGWPEDFHFEWRFVLMGFITIFFSLTLDFVMTTLVQMTAFWADNVWSLMVMLRFLVAFLGGGRIPMSLFPEWSQQALHWLPFYHILAFPTSVFMGDISMKQWIEGLVMTVVWIAVFYPLVSLVWKRGNLKYTGVGM